ncbi:MBOAT family protein [bacterium]|nr:MBOAT family protein [bacterium]
MLFNSIDFIVFLVIVFFIYWFVVNKNIRSQNLFILIASYIFYGWWDWRFLSLIIFSSFVDFYVGKALKTEGRDEIRKLLVLVSVVVNLGLLIAFKYYNFFIDSFVSAFSFFGYTMETNRLRIILPVGISFYTFQTLSYSIDVYRKKIKATTDFVAFFAFVSFFPQLVAGPIERASNLLPQFSTPRKFNYDHAVEGTRQILWGLFKKIVIADHCATYSNVIFNNYGDYSGSTLFLGAFFFTFQIYGDFSGYSDIAIGTAKLFGFKLMQNFAFPYFSRNIAEFWRRWHISLSSWFRDYLYIPLGGSRVQRSKQIRNIFIIFLVSGFWHGANWTFIVWGLIHSLLFLPSFFVKGNRRYIDIIASHRIIPPVNEIAKMVSTFCLIVLSWVFFRSQNIKQAFSIIGEIFSTSLFTLPNYPDETKAQSTIYMIIVMLVIEWLGRKKDFALAELNSRIKMPFRHLLYYSLLYTILWFSNVQQTFIYFQF